MLVVWRLGSIATGLAGLLACEEPSSGTDGGVGPRCSPTAAFGRPTGLTALNTQNNDEQATLSADELTLYFSRDDNGGAANGNYDIFQATRASKTAAFGAASAVAGVNTTTAQERGPRVTADGLTMYATSRTIPTATTKFRVTFATRASTADSFGPLQEVPVVNGPATFNDSDPFISADGRVLYFSSDRSGNSALYRSVKTGGTFSAPELVMGTNLNTTSEEATPLLSEDELTLFFASTRPGRGSADIYQANRASAQEPFGDPKPLNELNGIDPDIPSWISPDGCELYFTRFTPANNLELAVTLRGM
jgi:Tol biopolymer transport system component